MSSRDLNIVKMYRRGMTLPDVAELFRVEYSYVVNLVHSYLVKGVR